MGSVKFDLKSKEQVFANMVFTSFEDVYDGLWMLDALIDGYENMNVEAIVTKVDFDNLLETVESPVLNEYVSIQTGKNPMNVEDYELEITEVIANRLSISLKDCEEKLTKAIELLLAQKHREWFVNYLNNYKGKYIKNITKKKSQLHDLNNWQEIDYKKKYMWKNNLLPSDVYPNELNEMLEFRERNNEKIRKVEKSKNKEDLARLYRERVRIDQDISDIKKYYNIQLNKTNWKGKSKLKKSYNDDFDFVEDVDTYDSSVFDSLTYHKLQRLADEVLTDKQRVIFYLHFENQLHQREIAEIVDDTQGNISRDVKKIIEKLKKNL